MKKHKPSIWETKLKGFFEKETPEGIIAEFVMLKVNLGQQRELIAQMGAQLAEVEAVALGHSKNDTHAGCWSSAASAVLGLLNSHKKLTEAVLKKFVREECQPEMIRVIGRA